MSKNATPWLLRRSREAGRSPSSAKDFRQAGDKARDARDWAAAAEAYGKYLAEFPGHAAIWVQQGHALKEEGRLADAEQAYRKAVALSPDDADVMLHLAHLLKRLDRPQDAATMFLEVAKRAPSREVWQELENTGDGMLARASLENRPAAATRNGIYVELRDLFQYLNAHSTVTGITRVTLGLVNYILENMDEREAARYHFVQQFRDAEGAILISKDDMRRLVRASMSDDQNHETLKALIASIRESSPIFRLAKGDTYLIIGAFWEFVHNPSWISGMREQGVAIGSFIYDLIPITHARYCESGLTEAFTVSFAETARQLDFVLTISEFVAREVTDFLTSHGIEKLPTRAVPLAHELRFESERIRDGKSSVPTPGRRDYLASVPFVLCVCTIEARKNHIYIFEIWRRMLDAGIDAPDLVFVGRPGWRVQDTMDRIDDSRRLDGRLHILHGLTDEELAGLYDRCLFTVFPSFVEGWGLPVGESMAHGKVCVASSTTSIPEVGGDYAIYVDPFDVDAGFSTISTLIQNPATLARHEARLRQSFKPRTWKDVGQDFFAKIDSLLADVKAKKARPPFAPLVQPGRILTLPSIGVAGRRGAGYVVNPERLVFAGGWRHIEHTGTWMLDAEATLRVKTACEPGRAIDILLHLGTSPWVGVHNTLRIQAATPTDPNNDADAFYTRPMVKNRDFWVMGKARVEAAGDITVTFHINGPVKCDPPDVAVALRFFGIGYAPTDDLTTRLQLAETALLANKT